MRLLHIKLYLMHSAYCTLKITDERNVGPQILKPLTIVDNHQFSLESIATEIIPMKLEKAIFELPANSKTMKNPY
jgi:hypothetical protein